LMSSAHQKLNFVPHTLANATPWRWVTERGLRVETGATTLARYHTLLAANLAEVESVIPADGSLLIVLHPGAAPSVALQTLLSSALPLPITSHGRLHEIPVVYSGAGGQDLAAMAEAAGLSVVAAIALHCSVEYDVLFLGFQPGFAYLHGTPAVLQQPRLARPRTLVGAGSLAIGGSYTGIYPAVGPGGWHLIGRVGLSLFDPLRDPAALLAPGDRVRFVPQ
jgi:KipI family sensor histidine kinase inhibitor